ncbi:MAG: RIP metalloprotease RseP [Dehalococcoidia bacterium]|nr:RIP metalloprotease RseP [Dehalococcoidia bacterium]
MSVFLTVVLFVAILFFLITCHELGHFLASRRAGIVVEEFGIGLPPRLFHIKRGQTIYSINLIPVGAFVRPIGEDDPTVEGGLASKGPWTRMGVYAAGPLVNVVLAFVFISAFYMGVVTTRVVDNQGVMVHSVTAGSAAEEVGIQAGDVIVQIDDTLVARFGDISDALNANPGTAKSIVLQRGGVKLELPPVQPQYDQDEDRYILGVSLVSWLDVVTAVDADSPVAAAILPGDAILRVDGEWVYSRESFSKALDEASDSGEEFYVWLDRIKEDNTVGSEKVYLPSSSVIDGALVGVTTEWVEGARLEKDRRTPWQAVWDTGDFVIHLPTLIKDSIPLIRQDPGSALIGPVGAAQLTVEVVKVGGFANVLFLGGFISISLALFNFLPVPPLDGGGMLIALIEGIRGGKRLPQKAVRFVYIAGTALMILLFVVVFYGDIARLISGEGFPGL